MWAGLNGSPRGDLKQGHKSDAARQVLQREDLRCSSGNHDAQKNTFTKWEINMCVCVCVVMVPEAVWQEDTFKQALYHVTEGTQVVS